tara:strand:+ start:62 stop:391 length:330 start_codon:yes stop_codon:yes gene_type:complete
MTIKPTESPIDFEAARKWALAPIDDNPAIGWNPEVIENAARAYLSLAAEVERLKATRAECERQFQETQTKRHEAEAQVERLREEIEDWEKFDCDCYRVHDDFCSMDSVR